MGHVIIIPCMESPRPTLVAFLVGFASRLRFPALAAATAMLFVIDLLIPDFIPFADEIVLGFLTVLLGSLRKRRTESRKKSRL